MIRRLLLALVVVWSTTWSAAAAAPDPTPTTAQDAEVDGALRTLADQKPADRVRVIVQARRPQDALVAARSVAGRGARPLPGVGSLATEVNAGQVAALARSPGVIRVMLDPPMRLVQTQVDQDAARRGGGPESVFPQAVQAPELWAAGITGRGVGIAVLDSGVQPGRDFGSPSRIVTAERFNEGASSSADQMGHGTWVASVAAGDGSASGGRYVGVAPGASVINLKVSDDTGAAYASDVLEALGWVLKHRTAFNIRVVNLSFVSSVDEGYATSLLDAAVEMVWHAGVVVVVSAGNRGADSVRAAPANDPYVITVGASDDVGTAWPGDDTLSWFSSFGLTQDRIAKPDLVAPGRHIIGALSNPGATLARQYPDKVIASLYIQLSGTSASAPIVAGSTALLLQAYPQLTPDQVKWSLLRSARPLAGNPVGSGAGGLRIAGARQAAANGPGRANLGLTPNRLVALAYLAALGRPAVSWDSVSWDSVSWDSVSWDSVSWDSVSWDSVSWDSVSWDSVSSGSVSWDSALGD